MRTSENNLVSSAQRFLQSREALAYVRSLDECAILGGTWLAACGCPLQTQPRPIHRIAPPPLPPSSIQQRCATLHGATHVKHQADHVCAAAVDPDAANTCNNVPRMFV
ncbi:hypothetical protein WJX79_003234 [Trebouxia sp. C0005]